jgi:hypothetical protein
MRKREPRSRWRDPSFAFAFPIRAFLPDGSQAHSQVRRVDALRMPERLDSTPEL